MKFGFQDVRTMDHSLLKKYAQDLAHSEERAIKSEINRSERFDPFAIKNGFRSKPPKEFAKLLVEELVAQKRWIGNAKYTCLELAFYLSIRHLWFKSAFDIAGQMTEVADYIGFRMTPSLPSAYLALGMSLTAAEMHCRIADDILQAMQKNTDKLNIDHSLMAHILHAYSASKLFSKLGKGERSETMLDQASKSYMQLGDIYKKISKG